MSTSFNDAIGQIKNIHANVTDPNTRTALEQVITIFTHVKNSPELQAALGNLNGGNLSGNSLGSGNIGEASADVASPISDDVVNAVGLEGHVTTINPMIQSPIIITTMNHCEVNSVNCTLERVKTNFTPQNIESNISAANIQTWIPFLLKMEEAGLSDTMTLISLLEKHDGSYAKVLAEISN